MKKSPKASMKKRKKTLACLCVQLFSNVTIDSLDSSSLDVANFARIIVVAVVGLC